MRKLTVKNFSVIKDAELEFGKITVLIGPQASGKSLLCKLAYFLGREVISIAVDRVARGYDFADFESFVLQEFTRWFPKGGWGHELWFVSFSSSEFNISISASFIEDLKISFSDLFRSAYQMQLQVRLGEQKRQGIIILQALESLAATAFTKLTGRAIWDNSIYIPAERSYFVDTAKGYRALGAETNQISIRFADLFATSINASATSKRISMFLKGRLESFENASMIAFDDGRLLPFSYLSSGGKEILAILAILDYYERQRQESGSLESETLYGNRLYIYDDLTIEEPESDIFPQTQYELIKELAALSNEASFRPHFTVTTHSPYVLSVFNNLIEAWQIGHFDEARQKVVRAVIDEKYWVNPAEFRAYAMEDGVLKSIVAEDTGLISGNYLDSVSETIGAEFDELLRIGYVDA